MFVLEPCVPSLSFRYNRLIAIVFAYFNRKNNRYNCFVKPNRKDLRLIVNPNR